MRMSLIGYGLAIIIVCGVLSSIIYTIYSNELNERINEISDEQENWSNEQIRAEAEDSVKLLKAMYSIFGFVGFVGVIILVCGLVLSQEQEVVKVSIKGPVKIQDESMIERKVVEKVLIERINENVEKIEKREQIEEIIFEQIKKDSEKIEKLEKAIREILDHHQNVSKTRRTAVIKLKKNVSAIEDEGIEVTKAIDEYLS